jgi:hypothetical protein
MGTNFNPNKSMLMVYPQFLTMDLLLNQFHLVDQHKNNIGVKKRIRKNAYKARRGVVVPTVEMRKVTSKKKQQQLAKALKNVRLSKPI